MLLTAGRLFESGPSKLGKAFLEDLEHYACGKETNLLRLVLAMGAAAEAPPGTPLRAVKTALTDTALRVLGDAQRNDPEKERASLGHALGRLGDPRLDPAAEDRWVWVKPGSFEMGRNDGNASEKPAHSVRITRGFFLGKYPVTNAEYAAFMAENGYQSDRWWSPQGWAWQSMDERPSRLGLRQRRKSTVG